MEAGGRVVIADMEAGIGILTRMPEGSLDMALLVAEPSQKSIEVALRAQEVIEERGIGPTLVVANRVRDGLDEEAVQERLRAAEVVVVPDDPEITRADREGLSPLDAAPDCGGVQAIRTLAARLEGLRT